VAAADRFTHFISGTFSSHRISADGRWFVNDLGIDADPVWVTFGVVWQL
jgi:hypothetical protein